MFLIDEYDTVVPESHGPFRRTLTCTRGSRRREGLEGERDRHDAVAAVRAGLDVPARPQSKSADEVCRLSRSTKMYAIEPPTGDPP